MSKSNGLKISASLAVIVAAGISGRLLFQNTGEDRVQVNAEAGVSDNGEASVELTTGSAGNASSQRSQAEMVTRGKAFATSQMVKAVDVNTAVKKSMTAEDFEFKREMAEYAQSKKVILFSDQSSAERKRIVGDERLIRGLQSLLTAPSSDQSLEAMRNDGVDLLIDALGGPEGEAASNVLKAVVADAQVEDESLDQAVRYSLAGTKAEILYRWSASDPVQAEQMTSLLPGPVSQKIWSNVVSTQQTNLAESAIDMNR